MITLSILIVIALICAFVGCLMGLFSLVGKKARVVASDNVNPKAFRRLVDKMA